MKYLDLFSGYGGFSLGIEKAYEDIQRDMGSKSTKEVKKKL